MSEKLKQDHYKVKVKDQEENSQYLQGRGAQINTKNKFLKNEKTKEHVESIDDWEESNVPTQYLEQESKTIVNKVESPRCRNDVQHESICGLRTWLYLLLCKKCT
jgi:hypothetical protein